MLFSIIYLSFERLFGKINDLFMHFSELFEIFVLSYKSPSSNFIISYVKLKHIEIVMSPFSLETLPSRIFENSTGIHCYCNSLSL